ncbi:MAG TPA: GreA/GreB family elongation factor [Saprospiraceae bacterium]|nr:GreA/GreB family elongation factor [Saprospiraceae bacterium]
MTVLANVKILNKKTKKEQTYKLVSESEADLKTMKISVTSPIGQGLLGKKVGDEAIVKTPAGELVFEVLDISF